MDHQQTIDYLTGYRHEVDFALVDGVSLVLRKIRDKLSGMMLSPTQQMQLDHADEAVIITVMELDDIDAGLIDDDDAKPLTAWWWHLGKLRDRTYPAEQLPVHLQAVYTEVDKNAI